ncbi:hypothetical protein UlMin_001705 [Ulmus minor]
MANLRSHTNWFFLVSLFLSLSQKVLCYQYKVGDLDSWGIPTSANPQIYTKWSKYHNIRIGDQLLFFYPPSQDSVIQVTEESHNSCNLKDPILYMNNGNSLFNITKNGVFFFTSGEKGHCEKKQKIRISVGNETAFSPSYGPSALPDSASSPSYPTVFGSIPAPPSSSPSLGLSVFIAAGIGFVVSSFLSGMM